MIPENRKLSLEVVDHEEFVEIHHDRGPDGVVLNSTPIRGTESAFLLLKAPDGRVIRAQIPHTDLDPVLAMMIPDFTGSQHESMSCDDAVFSQTIRATYAEVTRMMNDRPAT